MEDAAYPCSGVQSVARMSHITDEQRCIIQRMKKAGHQQKRIAEAIGKSESAVSREIRRNCDQRSGA